MATIIDLATKAMQDAIKAVVDATKTVVDGIKTKTETIDTRTNTMNTNINAINTNVNTANTNINTIKTDVATIKASSGAVKSVQRGVVALPYASSFNYTANVTISPVALGKAMVNISYTFNDTRSNFSYPLHVRARLTSSTNLELYMMCHIEQTPNVAYEVIEFY